MSFAISKSRAVLESDRVRGPSTATGGPTHRNWEARASQFPQVVQLWDRTESGGPPTAIGGFELRNLHEVVVRLWNRAVVDQTNRRWIADRPPVCNQRLNVPVQVFYFCDQEYATSIL